MKIKKIFLYVFIFIFIFLLVVTVVYAITTISENLSTEGNLTVGGAVLINNGALSDGSVVANDIASNILPTMIFFNSDSITSASTDTYLSLMGNNVIEGIVNIPIPYNCIAKNLYVKTSGDIGGSGDSAVLTLRKNSTDTALTCTISGSTDNPELSITDDNCSDTSNTVSLSAGDLIDVELDVTNGGGLRDVYYKIGFECDK